MTPINRWGYIPDVRSEKDWDIRDHIQFAAGAVAPSGDIRLSYIKNQRQLGSCTGFGQTRVIRMARRLIGLPDVDLSELYAYFFNRLESGLPTNVDTGASIRASMDAARKWGACIQEYWNYKHAEGYVHVKPEAYATEEASKRQVLETYNVPLNIDIIKQTLAAGMGITYGTTVHRNAFEFAPSGVVQMPQANDTISGAHNIVLDRWDDSLARFGFPNSWGTQWGNQGYGTVPYEHVMRYGADLWAVKSVERDGDAPIVHNATVINRLGSATGFADVSRVLIDGKEIWHA